MLAVVGWLIWVVACDTLTRVHPTKTPVTPSLAAPSVSEHHLYYRFVNEPLTLAMKPPPTAPSLLLKPRSRQVFDAHTLGHDIQLILPSRYHDARDRFEEEFAIREARATPVKYQIAALKYQVDSVLSALDNFTQGINRATEWKPLKTKTSSGRISTLPLDETLVKLDVALMQKKPYVGFTVTIPFGN